MKDLNQANAYRSQGNYVEAHAILDKLISDNPIEKKMRLAYLHYQKGLVFDSEHKYADALTCFEKAAAINPKFKTCWIYVGILLDKLKRFSEAQTAFDQALALGSDLENHNIFGWKGHVFAGEGKLEEALDCYKKSTELNPQNKTSLRHILSISGQLKRYSEAHAAVDTLIALAPNDANLLNSKAGLFYEEGKYKEAFSYFEKALQLNPSNKTYVENRFTALSDLIDLYLSQNNYAEAHTLLDRLLIECSAEKNEEEHAALLNQKGLVFADEDKPSEALDYFEKAIVNDPYTHTYWHNAGINLDKLGRFDDAHIYLSRAISIAPDDADLYNAKALIYFHEGKDEKALRYFKAAIEIDKNNETYWRNKGMVLRRLNRLTQAHAALEQALSIAPNAADLHHQKGLIFDAENNYANALTCYESAIKLNPSKQAYLLSKATALSNLNRFDEAHHLFDQILALTPNKANALNNKGTVFFREKKFKDALFYFEKALQISPDNTIFQTNKNSALDKLIDASIRAGQLDILKNLITKRPDWFQSAEKNMTPLHVAVLTNQEDIACYLANQLPDNQLKWLLQLKSESGQTIVHLIAERNLLKLADCLFNHTKRPASLIEVNIEDLDSKDNQGKRPIDLAMAKCHQQMVDLLLAEHVSHVNVKGLERFDRSAALAVQLRAVAAWQEKNTRAAKELSAQMQNSINLLNEMIEKLHNVNAKAESNRQEIIEVGATGLENENQISTLLNMIAFQNDTIQNLALLLKNLYQQLDTPMPSPPVLYGNPKMQSHFTFKNASAAPMLQTPNLSDDQEMRYRSLRG